MSKMNSKQKRQRLHVRLRNKVSGSTVRPRLSVNFTGQHIYAQIINDEVGKTLVSVCSTEKTLKSSNIRPNISGAEKIGKLIAERAKAKKIESVVFDRGGFRYHGKVKALADAARSGGINF